MPSGSRLGTASKDLDWLHSLLKQLGEDFPEIELVESTRFAWHAGKKRVSFMKGSQANTERAAWSLLHELGHAQLGHTDYNYDIELLQLEAAAWDKAHELAKSYCIEIEDSYVQDCLDTYRDWLHMRATCPICFDRTLQSTPSRYRCLNCQTEWSVTRSRLCRPYRLKTPQTA